MNELLPDYNMANHFFDALTGSKDESITFQFFHDKDKMSGKATFRHMKRSPAPAFIHKKQESGCGAYVMVNQGDGKGRSKKNVLKVRALFVDLDGSPYEPAGIALKPHIRVESSPGCWHLYWLVNDCDLDQFKPIQQAIARKYNGDKSCCDLPRVLRVPGFYHLKNEPVMTKLIEANDFPSYSTQQVIDGLGLDLTESVKTSTRKTKEIKEEAPPVACLTYAHIDPKTGEQIDLRKWAMQNPGFDIVKEINSKFALGLQRYIQ